VEAPKQDGRRKWVKLWTQAWLRGPISDQDLATRAIFASLLALAGDNVGSGDETEERGVIRVAPGCGFTDGQIAKMLKVREETWVRNKGVLVEIKHICVSQANEITIVNWQKYQGDYVRVRESRARTAQNPRDENVSNVTDRSKKEEVRSKKKTEKSLLGATEAVAPVSDTKVSARNLMAHWNSKGNLTECRSWSGARQKKLRARCKDKDFVRYWREAIDAVSRNPYCTGAGQSSWVATIGWFLSHDKQSGDLNWAKQWEKGVTQEVKIELSREKIRKVEEAAEREAEEKYGEVDPDKLPPFLREKFKEKVEAADVSYIKGKVDEDEV